MPAQLETDDNKIDKYYVSLTRIELYRAIENLNKAEENCADSRIDINRDDKYITKIRKLIKATNKINKELGELYASDNICE